MFLLDKQFIDTLMYTIVYTHTHSFHEVSTLSLGTRTNFIFIYEPTIDKDESKTEIERTADRPQLIFDLLQTTNISYLCDIVSVWCSSGALFTLSVSKPTSQCALWDRQGASTRPRKQRKKYTDSRSNVGWLPTVWQARVDQLKSTQNVGKHTSAKNKS